MSTCERSQELHHREAALADPEEAREVLLGAPVGQPDRSVEDERKRVAELGHAGLRVPPDDRIGVEGRADAPRAAPRDEHRLGLRKLTVGATQRRLCIHPAVLLHRDPSVTGGAQPQVTSPVQEGRSSTAAIPAWSVVRYTTGSPKASPSRSSWTPSISRRPFSTAMSTGKLSAISA